MLTKVGRYLRQIRLDNNEILRDMALRLGVTSAFLSAVENGKKKMPKKLRDKLILEYGMDECGIVQLDDAVLESNDVVDINIKAMSEPKKELAVSFARSFENLTDEDVKFFSDYLKKRSNIGGRR